MKNLLLITIIALTVACSKNDPEGLNRNDEGIYIITTNSELEEFNAILEGDSTVMCVLAYAEKDSIVEGDLPYKMSSIYGLDLPECTSVGHGVFYMCTSLQTIDLPMCESVGRQAFLNCTSLTAISLPMCKSLNTQAFRYCTSLATINLPVCTSFGDWALDGCASLTNLSLLSMENISTDWSSFDDTREVTLNLNANGKEKDNIENDNEWKGTSWKAIILK